MLRTIKSLILIAALAGCAAMPWTATRQEALRQEAGYLAGLVKKNKITKVQAADRLDIKRIGLVGQNPYDDEVFAYYRHLAGERDHNRIVPSEAQSLMRKKLAEVRTRYRQDPGKPGKTPVFTNFMMEMYGLPPL
ncbi:hypothetical protein SCT_2404 [Sulfuricella sp. T08]|uniref:hypothetical protein n=1 Tax=Sulfuricella sp. T08 TaxID=1632857 RepID=UPI0006179DD5|nr:hypothetical protein [Sulfuricella sp. T08]GAO36989.1 hypothetical protein SCT_2404 [Sulfuricella sp. T08]